jgi:hypothetical protein
MDFAISNSEWLFSIDTRLAIQSLFVKSGTPFLDKKIFTYVMHKSGLRGTKDYLEYVCSNPNTVERELFQNELGCLLILNTRKADNDSKKLYAHRNLNKFLHTN